MPGYSCKNILAYFQTLVLPCLPCLESNMSNMKALHYSYNFFIILWLLERLEPFWQIQYNIQMLESTLAILINF